MTISTSLGGGGVNNLSEKHNSGRVTAVLDDIGYLVDHMFSQLFPNPNSNLYIGIFVASLTRKWGNCPGKNLIAPEKKWAD